MKTPRLFHKLYAKAFHYFWLPCPRCGEMFGGHELKNLYLAQFSAMMVYGVRKCVCPTCAIRAENIQMGTEPQSLTAVAGGEN